MQIAHKGGDLFTSYQREGHSYAQVVGEKRVINYATTCFANL